MKIYILLRLFLKLIGEAFGSFNRQAMQRADQKRETSNAKARAFDKLARSIKARRRVGSAADGGRMPDDGFKRND